ncbi:hypothetical protein [Pelosinus sp. UFO1]|uniref:hypothetical protein n=1 Tax=Pelosinus sp. UFO1 TaxID=484770 RepID=UPI0004D12507|nr:hypothetical protein [Pelosinus sp. UFO1]AIF51241.1 hypothetical protein UFO1_1690 [Pelosinus sp. UFO1]
MIYEKTLKKCMLMLKAILFMLIEFVISLFSILSKLTFLDYIVMRLICSARRMFTPINKALIKSRLFSQLSMSISFQELQAIRDNNSISEGYRSLIKLITLFTDINDIENYKGEKFYTDTNQIIYGFISNKRRNPLLKHMKIEVTGIYKGIQPCEKLNLMHSRTFVRSVFSKKIIRLVQFIYRVETMYVLEIEII